MLRHILTLARASNLPSVWSNCLAATLISGAAPTWLTLLLLAGVAFLYAGGCTLNDAFDAEWDARNRPERLIPSGVLSRRLVWTIGLFEIAGGLLFISGQIPLEPASGEIVEGDIEAQTDQVLKNLLAILSEAKLGPENVVKTTVFLADLADFPKMNEVYARVLGKEPPARSTVQAAGLPRGVLVEIDAIAAF